MMDVLKCDKCGGEVLLYDTYPPEIFFHCKECLKLTMRYMDESCRCDNRYKRIQIESTKDIRETIERTIRNVIIW